jgi:hypothetical protein
MHFTAIKAQKTFLMNWKNLNNLSAFFIQTLGYKYLFYDIINTS